MTILESRSRKANSPFGMNFIWRALVAIGILMIALALTHCGGMRTDDIARGINKNAPNKEAYFDEQVAAETAKNQERASGSLWVDSYSSNLYTNMYRASKIGDTVTIVISEEAIGKRESKTNTKRSSSMTAGVDELGGLMQKLAGLISNFNPAKIISAKTESKFDGTGKVDSKGSLYARLTCRVTERLKNGDMVIRGEKHVKVYKEEQILVLEGIIRPYDILPDNTVSSVNVADARISFTGLGVVAEKQSPGWLARLLDYVWPF